MGATSMLRILVWLAVAQVIGWGTVGLPTVAGSTMASDLGLSLPTIFWTFLGESSRGEAPHCVPP
jgi:hypothetical protein